MAWGRGDVGNRRGQQGGPALAYGFSWQQACPSRRQTRAVPRPGRRFPPRRAPLRGPPRRDPPTAHRSAALGDRRLDPVAPSRAAAGGR
ncbi:hypothetical protein QJS66_14620 [Kocuria rhizophila]|nr:hypothetical protein QJS66_14620 [Kocuria rhizophila]